eukprot:Hpha_TRINITY_DN11304_c0_g2::TRINITY_DN11304_c0_g2_i1::g.63337::m.63337
MRLPSAALLWSCLLTGVRGGGTCGNMPEGVLDAVVVGGGLSGLVVARELHKLKQPKLNWALLEARPVLGGRLENDGAGLDIDLGGAWVWPRQQRLGPGLVEELGLETFGQLGDHSSHRVKGGAVRMVRGLEKGLPEGTLRVDSPVVGCKKGEDGVVVLSLKQDDEVRA